MTNPITVSPLRQRMIEDMIVRSLGRATQRNHIRAGKLFAAYIKRSSETATPDDVRLFQMSLIERGLSIQNRNRIMTGLGFLLRVTMRRHETTARYTRVATGLITAVESPLDKLDLPHRWAPSARLMSGADGAIACFNNPLIEAMSSPLAP